MSNSQQKYSILIPTRDGARYVGAAIQSVLDQPYEDFQLVVSVDASRDNSLEVASSFQDPRLKVISPPDDLSMAGHYEWCLSQATGRWVTILGQDDALFPDFFHMADRIISQMPRGLQAISFRRAYFFWPGTAELYGDIVMEYSSRRSVKQKSSRIELLKSLFGISNHFDLPQLYTNNLISRELIQDIQAMSDGRLYHDVTPDVYSGVAIAMSTRRFLRCELPLFWTGTSPASTGFAISVGKDPERADDDLRATGHFDRARSEGLQVAEEIGDTLLRQANVSPLYILSALRQLPFLPRRWRGKWPVAIGLVAACRQVRADQGRSPAEREAVIAALQSAARDAGLSRLQTTLGSAVVGLAGVWARAMSAPGRIAARVRWRLGVDPGLRSSNREEYPDITSATRRVMEFRPPA